MSNKSPTYTPKIVGRRSKSAGHRPGDLCDALAAVTSRREARIPPTTPLPRASRPSRNPPRTPLPRTDRPSRSSSSPPSVTLPAPPPPAAAAPPASVKRNVTRIVLPPNKKRPGKLRSVSRTGMLQIMSYLSLADLQRMCVLNSRFYNLLASRSCAGAFFRSPLDSSIPRPLAAKHTAITRINPIVRVLMWRHTESPGRVRIVPTRQLVALNHEVKYMAVTRPTVAFLEFRIRCRTPPRADKNGNLPRGLGRMFETTLRIENEEGVTLWFLLREVFNWLQGVSRTTFAQWHRETPRQQSYSSQNLMMNRDFLNADQMFPRQWYIDPECPHRIIADYSEWEGRQGFEKLSDKHCSGEDAGAYIRIEGLPEEEDGQTKKSELWLQERRSVTGRSMGGSMRRRS
ncbi:hypothetical protein EDC01DRAFT_725271 [Geopyxis carbonaria]|nr:hypothetical protein EDC01DRAFT_725271 [Geopyxis carbonaria]